MDDCANYLLNYAPYLHYDKALAEGVPIASGVIEGTCRHLVEDGMNITGARWGLAGAEAVLRLRALRASDDFDAYWEFHEQQEYERHHAIALRRSSCAGNCLVHGLLISTQPSPHPKRKESRRSHRTSEAAFICTEL